MSVGWKRILVLLLAVVLQLLLFIAPIYEIAWMREIVHSVSYVFMILSLLHLFRSELKPDYKIPWLIIIMVAPFFGSIAYIVYGNNFGREKRIAIYEKYMKDDNKAKQLIETQNDKLEDVSIIYRKQANYLLKNAYSSIYGNTRSEYFPLGDDMFVAMLRELKKAEKYIFMEYFIVEDGKMWGSILEILKEKAASGVEVRFCFDALGSIMTAPSNMVKELNNSGIQCISFNSKMRVFSSHFNNRDHRKICSIDGKIAFTGGANLADEYINEKVVYGHWKDTAIMLEGDAAWSLTVMFLSFWAMIQKEEVEYTKYLPLERYKGECDGLYVPYTDFPADDEEVGEFAYINMLNSAKEYVYITTPYLILDSVTMSAFVRAAKNGIDVRIIIPGIPDKKLVYMLTRSYYKPLLDSGVRIFEYTPGFVHAKEFVSDDMCAIIGTINLDYRSLTHHFENAVWMYNSKTVIDIKEDFIKTQMVSKEVFTENKNGALIMNGILLPILRAFSSLF